MKKLLLSITLFACVSTFAMAQSRAEKRQNRQQARLNQGVASGEVNRAEQARLQGRIDANQRAIDAANADGKVTKKEKKVIEARQDNSSAHEYRQKHDKNKRKH